MTHESNQPINDQQFTTQEELEMLEAFLNPPELENPTQEELDMLEAFLGPE